MTDAESWKDDPSYNNLNICIGQYNDEMYSELVVCKVDQTVENVVESVVHSNIHISSHCLPEYPDIRRYNKNIEMRWIVNHFTSPVNSLSV